MGAFDSQKNPPPAQVRETFPEGVIDIQSEDGQFTVRARVVVTPEDEQYILNRYLNTLAREKRRLSIEKQASLLDSLWLERLILSWNLPIPLGKNRAQAIARLSQADRDFIYQRIMAAQPEKPLREKRLSQRPLSAEIKAVIQKRQSRGNMV